MTLTNLKLAWRNLLRKKLFAVINVAGLAVGICTCLVIFLIVRFETSFDRHHADSHRIYRVYTEFSGVFEGANRGVIAGAANFMKSNAAGIELVVPFHEYYTGDVKVRSADGELKKFGADKKAAVVGPEFFDMFNNYTWLSGSAGGSFGKYEVVLTESQARKYFGETTATEGFIGKSIIYRDSISLTVSGVLADPPKNTDLYFTDFISFETAKSLSSDQSFYDDWSSTNSSSQLFLKLQPGKSPDDLSPQLLQMGAEYQSKNEESDWSVAYRLQPLSDMHYNVKLGILDSSRGAVNLQTLKILGLLAGTILLIASINFINLETAQAGRRAKEIGIRKVLGSSRGNLITQFLTESVILSLLALAIALPLCQFALVYFQEFIPPGLSFDIAEGPTLMFLGGIVLLVGFVSGLYPAYVISGFLPVKALKASIYTEKGTNFSAVVRKSLTVFQFCLAQILIACTLVIIWQTKYLSEKDLGFSSNNIVTIQVPYGEPESKKQVFLAELENISGIRETSLHQSPPADGGYSSSMVKHKTRGEEVSHLVYRKSGDVDYFSFYNMPLLAGRVYMPNDSVFEMVVNKRYAQKLGFSAAEDVLLERVTLNDHEYTIVGVIDDVNLRSLHNAVDPMAVLYQSNGNCVGVKLGDIEGTAQVARVLAEVEAVWNKVYPDRDFKYNFLDETIDRFYQSEKRAAKLVTTATIIAIIISCMGLFGLASFSALQRTKEIGIRKVLGASVRNIMLLLSADFLKLVMVAFVIAAPLAYWLSQKWLADFAYRITPGVWLFAATGLMAIVVALLTVSQQAFKAASENPVKALRNE